MEFFIKSIKSDFEEGSIIKLTFPKYYRSNLGATIGCYTGKYDKSVVMKSFCGVTADNRIELHHPGGFVGLKDEGFYFKMYGVFNPGFGDSPTAQELYLEIYDKGTDKASSASYLVEYNWNSGDREFPEEVITVKNIKYDKSPTVG